MQELVIADNKYRILELPGRPKALLDSQVAEIYQVETREINQAVERNPDKFPPDFFFQLTQEEKEKVITNCDILSNIKYSRVTPRAFTPEGCNMLATILQSSVATQRAIQIVRGFTRLEQVYYSAKQNTGNDLLAQAKLLVQTIERQCQIEDEQKRQAERLKQIEARQEAFLNPDGGYYSIMGYANLKGIRQLTRDLAAALGKLAADLSRASQLPIGKVPDPRFGQVGTYHESVLDEAFTRFLKSRPTCTSHQVETK